MTTGVVSKNYVSHYQQSFAKKKKVKARFNGIFYIIGKRIFDVVVSLLYHYPGFKLAHSDTGYSDQVGFKGPRIFRSDPYRISGYSLPLL